MGDIARTILRPQRQGDALRFDCRVAAAGSREQLPQGLVDLLVGCDQPAANGRQEIASG